MVTRGCEQTVYACCTWLTLRHGRAANFSAIHAVRAAATLGLALLVQLLDGPASAVDARHPLSGAEVTGTPPATGNSPIVVPLRLRRHFPLIVAKIDGLDVPLVFDSGDQSTVALHRSVLDAIRAVPTDESERLQFSKGPTVESAKFRIRRLQIGQAVFTDIIGRLDSHDPSYQATDVGQKGFLGTGLLKPYELVLDYRKRRMTLIPRGGDERPSLSCRGTDVPFASLKEPAEPVTEITTDLGAFLAWWDTGTPTSVITKRFVDKAQPKQFKDRLTTRRLVLGRRDFGPWRFEVWDATLPPWFEGLIGYDFFVNHTVCMDFPDRRVVVVR